MKILGNGLSFSREEFKRDNKISTLGNSLSFSREEFKRDLFLLKGILKWNES
jgi:hypothetical protein